MLKPVHVNLESTDQPCEECASTEDSLQYTFPITQASGVICQPCMQKTLDKLNAYIPESTERS